MWGLGLHLGSRAGGLRAFLGQQGLVAELVETALGFFHTPPHPLAPHQEKSPASILSHRLEMGKNCFEAALHPLPPSVTRGCWTEHSGEASLCPAAQVRKWQVTCPELAGLGLGLRVGAGSAGTAPGKVLGAGRRNSPDLGPWVKPESSQPSPAASWPASQHSLLQPV